MSAPRRPRLRAFAVLALLIAVAYGQSLRNGFVFDDAIFVERDHRLRSLEGVGRLFTEPLWGFTDKGTQRGIHQYYRPFQLLAPAASVMLLGGAAWPVHLLSLVLHLACALMVYELLVRAARATRTHDYAEAIYVGASRNADTRDATASAALFLAAVFAVHPANSEAVLWASDLSGLGATACMLAAVLLHAGSRPAVLSAPLVGALCFGAALFKESGVLVPALLALYDLFLRRRARPGALSRSTGGILADYAAASLALAAYFAMRVRALGGVLPGARDLELGPRELVLNAFALVPSYLRAFFWPFDLNMYHDFAVAYSLTDWRVLAGAGVALAIMVAALASARRAPVVAFGLGWAALTVSPWLAVRWPQLNAFAERYLYLPSIGLLAAAMPLSAALATRADGRLRPAAAACAAALIVAFVARDAVRTRDWRDEVTIYSKTLEQSPRAELVRNNLALRYLENGEPARGIPIQEELLRIDSDFPNGWHNMGLLLLAVGRTDDARAAFERSASLEPGNAATALNLGYVYDLQGRREEAVEKYFLATILDRGDLKPWYNLAVIAYEQGQLDNSRRAVEEVLSRAPGDRAAQTLKDKLAATQGPSAAATPADADATLRRCNAARAAAEAGRPPEAVVKLEAAAWLDERSPLPHHYLANLRYLGGRLREAHRHESEALQRAPENELYRANVAALKEILASKAGASAAPSFP